VQIIAYIKPNKLPPVSQALNKIEGLLSLSFSAVRGFDVEQIADTNPLTAKELVDYAPYVRIEIFCADDLVYEARCVIETAAHTDQNGGGKIYVLEVGQAIHFQSDERAESAPLNGGKAEVALAHDDYA
jgi:nitrogen regulatory protein PII